MQTIPPCRRGSHNHKGVITINTYIIIAGVNGTGKSSFRGVLDGQGANLGHIIDPDEIAKKNNGNNLLAGKMAVNEIKDCLNKNITFTQETTLSGKTVEKTIKQARKQGYYISLYYIGLNSSEESITRIANRVRKGGHNIPSEAVNRRFLNRFEALAAILSYCDEVAFYDNENGFIKVAEIKNNTFRYVNSYRPDWITELESNFINN